MKNFILKISYHDLLFFNRTCVSTYKCHTAQLKKRTLETFVRLISAYLTRVRKQNSVFITGAQCKQSCKNTELRSQRADENVIAKKKKEKVFGCRKIFERRKNFARAPRWEKRKILRRILCGQ